MSSNITPSFDEAFKHIKYKLPSDTLKTLEQNYNNNMALNNLHKQDLKTSNFPSANTQIEQSKLADLKDSKELEDIKVKTDDFKKLKSQIEYLESSGQNVSKYKAYLKQKEKELEIGYGDKFGVVGRRLPIMAYDTYREVKEFLGAKDERMPLSHSQKMDKAKYEREEAINPLKTAIMTDAMNPLNLTPLSYASKGGKLIRFAKDFSKNGVFNATTDALVRGGTEDYKFTDSLYAGGIGGLLGGVAGQFFGKSLKSGANAFSQRVQSTRDNPSVNKAINQTEDLANSSKASTFNENITDDDIASKIVQKRFNEDVAKSPQDMSTQELFTNIFESMKKQPKT